MAQRQPSGQITHDSLYPWPETSSWHFSRPRRRGDLPTGWAAQPMLSVFSHFGLDWRNIADLMARRIGIIAQQEAPALATRGGPQFDHRIDLFRWQEFPGASLMTGLTTTLATARLSVIRA